MIRYFSLQPILLKLEFSRLCNFKAFSNILLHFKLLLDALLIQLPTSALHTLCFNMCYVTQVFFFETFPFSSATSALKRKQKEILKEKDFKQPEPLVQQQQQQYATVDGQYLCNQMDDRARE